MNTEIFKEKTEKKVTDFFFTTSAQNKEQDYELQLLSSNED